MLSPEARKLKSLWQGRLHLPADCAVTLALSGGGDSVALLHLLTELRGELHLHLSALHLNHLLRPTAGNDEAFVEDLCASLDVPLICERADCAGWAGSHGLSLEEAGRSLRYDFFRRAAVTLHSDYLFTAHTQDDQAETLLMRMVAGTGVRGLGGISPCRALTSSDKDGYPCRLVRPLLRDFTRRELRLYLERHHLSWREDETNLVPGAPRTKVRLQLLPLLKEWNPSLLEALSRLAESAAGDEACLTADAERLASQALLKPAGGRKERFIWNASVLRRAPAPLRLRLWRNSAEELGSPVTFAHLNGLENLLGRPQDGGRPAPGAGGSVKLLNLPGGVLAWREGDLVGMRRLDPEELSCQLSPASPGFAGRACPQEYTLGEAWRQFTALGPECVAHTSKEFRIPYWNLKLTLSCLPEARRPRDMSICLNPECLPANVTVRGRRAGDSFRPAGGTGSLKLKKYFNELGIPPEMRDRVPLLTDGEGNTLLWVIGHRADQRFLARPGQKNVWLMEAAFLPE